MEAPPIAENESDRLIALAQYGVLDTPPEPDYDALAELAAQICGTSIAMVSLVDDRRQWFKARVGIEEPELPRETSFCGHALAAPDLFIIPDAAQDPRFHDNPLVVEHPKVRFYAGAPLRTPEGHVLGALCVMDHKPHRLSLQQTTALKTLGRQVMAQLDLRRRVSEMREQVILTSDILDSLTSDVAVLDARGTILRVNAAWERFCLASGVPEEASSDVGANYFSSNGEADPHFEDLETAAAAIAGIRDVTEGREPTFSIEYPCHSVAGKRWFKMRASRLTGQLAGAVVAHHDITERKLADEKLREREEQLSLYAQHSPVAIAMLDLDMRYLVVSRRWMEDFSLGEKSIIGRCHYDVFPEIPQRWKDILRRCMAGAVERRDEDALMRPDGSTHWLRWEVRPWRRANGEIGGLILFSENITARRLAEHALHESETRLHAVTEGMTEGLVVTRLDGQLLHWNPAALSLHGFTNAEEWCRMLPEFTSIFELSDVEGRVLPYDEWPMPRMFRGEKVRDLELRIRRLDTDWERVFRYGGGIVQTAREKVAFLTMTDVTEHREASEALESNRRFLSDLIEHSGSLVFVKDCQGRYQLVNKKWEETTLRTREEILGKTDAEVFPGSGGENYRRADLSVIESGEARTVEERLDDNGNIRHFLSVKFPLRDASGKATGLCGMATEITERKRAEEKVGQQAALLDRAQDAILVRDLQNGIEYWNNSAERLYGWSRKEALGASVKELLYDNPAAFLTATDTVLATGDWLGEIEQKTKDGRRLTVEGRWTLVRDEQGNPKSILAINTDITERKKLEQQFLRAQRMESIGTLAGGIAHDLNNVLGPIMLAIDLLKVKCPDRESAEILSTISTSADRGADMVRQVLTFARGLAGQRLEVQVRHLVKDIEKIVNETFLKHIRVRTILPTELWTVIGDATQLHQILLNLCVNARDAMPHGGVLTISAENVTIDAHYASLDQDVNPGPYICLQVEDSGTGMTPEIVERIFDPFFTTKEVGKGTGLGLSTTLAIVKSHAGFVRVYSEVGKGSKFKIYLPASTERMSSDAAEEPPELPRGEGETILVVDDEASVRLITQQTLQAFGYRVMVACDGAEALAIFASKKAEISVVLTDMMMPVMDGPAVIQVLKKLSPELPIVAASGLSTDGQVGRAMGLGVRHFLPKPYTAETLLRVLKEVLHP